MAGLLGVNLVFFIIYVLIGCLWGGITSAIVKDKNLTSPAWFWCGFASSFLAGFFGGIFSGFLGGIPAVIIAVTLPAYNGDEVKQDVENRLVAMENEKRLQETGWRCSCGNLNASYTGTCSCGKGKGEV